MNGLIPPMGCNPASVPPSPFADAASVSLRSGFTPWQSAACGRRVTLKKNPAIPMITTLSPNIAEEKSEPNFAANRFMHLLHHPEVQNYDGEQTDRTRNRFMNDLTRTSVPMPLVGPKNKESVITTKLRKTGRVMAKATPRDIAYWIAKAAEHKP